MTEQPIKIGVTGTRLGMTVVQQVRGLELLTAITKQIEVCPELHHGDCVGADEQLHDMAESLRYWTVAHPPTVERYRSHRIADVIRAPKPYLVRNEDIVDETELLLAFPAGTKGSASGGTWYTVRYARKVGRRLVIVWPDGTETP